MNCLQCFIAFMQPVVKLDSGHLPDLEKALASGGIIDLCGCTFSGELAQSTLLVGSNTTLCNGTILLPNNSLVRAAGGTYSGGRLKIVCCNVCLSVTLGGESNFPKSNPKEESRQKGGWLEKKKNSSMLQFAVGFVITPRHKKNLLQLKQRTDDNAVFCVLAIHKI